MVGEYFQYQSVGKDTTSSIDTDLFTFKCLFKQSYILEVECHPDSIYIIKFYQKNHRDSKNRYSFKNSKLIQKKPERTRNFLMILNTVMMVILDVYSENKDASFGFLGAPSLDELNIKKNKPRINEDGTVQETKRYNIYSIYVRRYFDPEMFTHIEFSTSSSYLIWNKSNTNLSINKVEEFFANYIEIYA